MSVGLYSILLCLCISLSGSLHSVYLYICPRVCLSVCLPISLPLSLSVPLCIIACSPLRLTLCALSPVASVCLSRSVGVPLYPSLFRLASPYCVYLAPRCLSQSPQDCMSVSIPISVSTCMSLCLRVFVLLCLSMRLCICVMAVHSVSLSVSPRHYLSVSVSVLRRLQRQRQRQRRRRRRRLRNILVGCLLWGVPRLRPP